MLKFAQQGMVAAAPFRLLLFGLLHLRNSFAEPIRRIYFVEDAAVHVSATPAGHRPIPVVDGLEGTHAGVHRSGPMQTHSLALATGLPGLHAVQNAQGKLAKATKKDFVVMFGLIPRTSWTYKAYSTK